MVVAWQDLLKAVPLLLAPVAGVLRGQRRRLERTFLHASATSADRAIPRPDGGPILRWWLVRLTSAGVLVQAPRERLWLDEGALARWRSVRRWRALGVLAAVVIVALLALAVTRSSRGATLMRPLGKVALPLAVLLVAGQVARWRGMRAADLGFVAPGWRFFPWVAAHVAYMLASDRLMDWRGPWDLTTWQAQGVAASALRLLAVCLVGPFSEEFVFRGVLFHRLRARGTPMAVVTGVLAVGWALMHVGMSPGVLALFVGAGLLLGTARWKTGSLWTPVAMHIAWNLYAVW